jgi:large subunit ribosomal protein L18
VTQGPRYHVKPRRRREGRTDYRKRLKLLRSGKIRAVVRKSIKNTQIQLIEYKQEGDKILASANSNELKKLYNWKFSTSSTPAAYLTGFLAGTRAKNKGIKECVVDTGRHPPITGSKIFASIKGLVDAGVKINHSEEKIPNEDRIMGKHIAEDIMPAITELKSKISGGK